MTTIKTADTKFLYSYKYDLADTIVYMTSPDYKNRFLGEFLQLAIRLEKLLNMLEKWDKGLLDFEPTCSKHILVQQAKAMSDYVQILMDRAKIEGITLPVPVANPEIQSERTK